MISKLRSIGLALLLASCTTTREEKRQTDVVDRTQTTEHRAENTQTAAEVMTIAGPISTSEEDELIIPAGSVIETPAGRVQLPANGPAAHIFRRARALEGPVRTETEQKTATQATAEIAKAQSVTAHEEEKTKSVTRAGPGWRLWLGLFLALAIVLAVLWFALKSHLPSIPWPWSRP
jgi:anti-sigma factor ChrR (cupin superfamily)